MEKITVKAIRCDDDTRFRKNRYNIYEPEDGDGIEPQALDMVFVPILAFDKKGFRVGYGKGYYDRFLKQCRNDCVKIGFSYFPPLDGIEDRDEYDVPLNLCVTPASVYAF